eukprot:Awhi_evm1s5339
MKYLELNPTGTVEESDNWKKVRPFLTAVNTNWRQRIHLGTELCIDEAMCHWHGKNGLYYGEDGLPHVTKIKRKPRGIGLELKAHCCGESGLMLRLELQESKEAMATKEYVQDYGAGTACVARMLTGYRGYIENGDSAFSSVKTAVFAKKERGCGYRGAVKTATKMYPKAYINRKLKDSPRGSSIYLTAVHDGVKLIATGWKEKNVKCFISTVGVSSDGPDSIKKRARVNDDGQVEYYTYNVKRPLLVHDYFEAAGKIDVHDHLRQGGLQLENFYRTQRWYHRCFSTLLGMIETNAFLGYKLENPKGEYESHTDFTNQLAYELIHNPYVEEQIAVQLRSASQRAFNQVDVNPSKNEHTLQSLSNVQDPKIQALNDRRRECSLKGCKRKTAYYCAQCSDRNSLRFFMICSTTAKGKTCHVDHTNEVETTTVEVQPTRNRATSRSNSRSNSRSRSRSRNI